MSIYNFKKKGRRKHLAKFPALSSSSQDRNHFAPTDASIHWVIRARETFQSQVPAEDSHPPTEGKVRVHPLDMRSPRPEEADLPEGAAGTWAQCSDSRAAAPYPGAGHLTSHSLHRELPGRTATS